MPSPQHDKVGNAMPPTRSSRWITCGFGGPLLGRMPPTNLSSWSSSETPMVSDGLGSQPGRRYYGADGDGDCRHRTAQVAAKLGAVLRRGRLIRPG